VWLGEDVWIDNLGFVSIGSHSCISQGAYLCTGSHNWSTPGFELIVRPIQIGSHVWVAAKAMIGPGVTISDNSVITLGSVVTQDIPPSVVFSGSINPVIKSRPGY
jgi:putative colanic acid biosynthesis acetyltransferase WcaF